MRNISFAVKRLMDIILCIVVFIFVLPLLILIPILVKISSPGPVFFIQKRIGQDKKQFNIVKFRTMIPTSKTQSKKWSKEEENRITTIGRFLRDFGLDELPQMYNILKGEMSIIGPRALMPMTIDDLPLEDQRKLAKMRPGVLCLSAIRGRRSLPMHERIEYQIKYVNEWSLSLDLKILWKSLFVVLFHKDANEITIEPKCNE